MIVNALIRAILPFSEKELIFLITYWNHDFSYLLSLKMITNQLKRFVETQSISEGFIAVLKDFLQCKTLKENDFSPYADSISIIERILINHSGICFEDGTPLFLLLPDPFGDFVNQTITEYPDDKRDAFSMIAKVFSKETKITTAKEAISIVKSLEYTMESEALKSCIRLILENASRFTPRTKEIQIGQGTYGIQYYIDYEPMRRENIMIIKGLVLLAGHYKIRSAITPIQKLAERSYIQRSTNVIGPGARILGNCCIHVLAHHFGNRGHGALHELYEFTTYKSIRTQIEKESAILEQNTGTPLL
ncbi:hypothetical protein [Aquimarina pacifica]|uniref:hypothetical protein n=1 Tax=Aquimarina pacifica TaxID=1296415 RepID=UPI000470EAA9|nr:hypothetical protein [Aquimarina pacifica]